MSLNMNFGVVQPGIIKWMEKSTLVIKNGMFVLGAFSILAIDVVTGPVFLGNFNTTHSVLYAVMFWLISLALTATQMIFWDHALKEGFNRYDWKSYAPAIAVGVLMLVDTLLDVGFVTQMLYPNTPASQLLPHKIELIWYMLVLCIGIISLACEPLLMWFFKKLRSEDS
jgi:hypothetical protein